MMDKSTGLDYLNKKQTKTILDERRTKITILLLQAMDRKHFQNALFYVILPEFSLFPF